MFQRIKTSFLLLIVTVLTACNQEKKGTISVVNWTFAQQYYSSNIDIALAYIDSLETEGMHGEKSKTAIHKGAPLLKITRRYIDNIGNIIFPCR